MSEQVRDAYICVFMLVYLDLYFYLCICIFLCTFVFVYLQVEEQAGE